MYCFCHIRGVSREAFTPRWEACKLREGMVAKSPFRQTCRPMNGVENFKKGPVRQLVLRALAEPVFPHGRTSASSH
uniref:Uncharacterized protein n=1 Tax=Trichuris muris TaxID=70415 RepID=A0A5S6QIG1_TRIMR